MSDEELSGMKDALLRGQALKAETLGDKLRLVQDITRNGLPDDVAAQDMARIQSMTAEDADALSNANIRPREMRVVVVGDAASQLARLRGLGYRVVTVD